MREIVHLQAGQCGNQIGAKVSFKRKKNKEKFIKILNIEKRSRKT